MMQVKTMKIEPELIEAWRKKYGKRSDAKIRELMVLDLKSK